MWRFVEEGPLLKFPLRVSPFMAADPLYRDVTVVPPVKFTHLPLNEQDLNQKAGKSFAVNLGGTHTLSAQMDHSSQTIENSSGLDVSSVKSRNSSPHSLSSSTDLV